MEKVDKIVIGGGMVFTFLKARGLETGSSLVEEDQLELATKLEKIAKDHKILIVTFHAVRRFHAPGAMRWEGVLTPYNGIP